MFLRSPPYFPLLARLRDRFDRLRDEVTAAIEIGVAMATAARARASRRRAEHAWDGWNKEDVEAELRDWPRLVDVDRPVDWGRFENRSNWAAVRVFVGHVYAEQAKAWKERHQEVRNLSMLVYDADGAPHWPMSGPIMARELWLVRFVLMYALGVDEAMSVALGKRVINEWHGLEPDTGLDDNELRLLAGEQGRNESA